MSNQHQGPRRPDQTKETAARYLEEFPWANEPAMRISLLLFDASAEQSAALTRMFNRVGASRTRGRYTALRILLFAPNRRLTQNEIRAAMNVTSPNVTYLIDELEKEGLVRRVAHPGDRRATLVELTPEGDQLVSILAPAMARFMGEMSSGFSEEEKKLFHDFLLRFMQNASSNSVD